MKTFLILIVLFQLKDSTSTPPGKLKQTKLFCLIRIRSIFKFFEFGCSKTSILNFVLGTNLLKCFFLNSSLPVAEGNRRVSRCPSEMVLRHRQRKVQVIQLRRMRRQRQQL